MSKLSQIHSGVAGEYFVAAELSRRGYTASLTLRNTRGIDILASNGNATKSVGIQVKTNQTGKSEWVLSEKVERDVAENLYFVFVTFRGLDVPEYHVAPWADVARYVSESHRRWLNSPGRHGQARRDSQVRKFADRDKVYRDQWMLLGLD